MFCMKCGRELPQDAAFCCNCGAKTGVEPPTVVSVADRNQDNQSAGREVKNPETIQTWAAFCDISGTLFAAGPEAWFVPWKYAKFLDIFGGLTAYPKIKNWRIRLCDVQCVQLIVGPLNCGIALHLPDGIAKFVIGSKFRKLDEVRAFKTALEGMISRNCV